MDEQRRQEIHSFLAWMSRGIEKGGQQDRIGRWRDDPANPDTKRFEPLPAVEQHRLVEQYLAKTQDTQATQ